MKRMRSPLFAAVGIIALGIGSAYCVDLAPGDLKAKDLSPLAQCKEAKGEAIVWIKDGKALLPIVADEKNRQVKQAARFLQGLVFRMTGVKPAIVAKAQGAAVRIATPVPRSGAFAVKTADGSILLTGHGVYAVYDFAERVLGFRRYFNPERGGDSVIKTKGLAIPPLDYADRPVYAFRSLHPYGIPWMQQWKIGNDCDAGMTVHAPHRWNTDTNFNYRVTRPEIFERREDGQRGTSPMLCYGNPKTLETYLERIEEQCAGGRGSGGIFGSRNVIVSQWDGSLCCTCPHCTRLKDVTGPSSGTYSPVIWGEFTRKLSDAMKKSHPDFLISILPYNNTCDLPKGLVFTNGNVQAWLVTMPGLAMLKDDRVKRHEENLIRTWAKGTGKKVVNWHYFVYPAQFTTAPFLYCKAMVSHWRDMRDFVEGTYMDSYNEKARRGELNAYVWFRALWNPEIDVDAIADEFAKRMFGAAAKEMREVIRMQEDGWNRRWEHPNISQKNIFVVSYPREDVKRMEALIATAKERVKGDEQSTARLNWYAAQFDQFFKDSEEYATGSKYTPFVMMKTPGTPKIDGILDDPCWQKIEPREFVEGLDRTRAKPPVRTYARVAWFAEEGICFGIRCEEPFMDKAQRSSPPCTNNETVEIFFDPSGEGCGDYAQLTLDISGGWKQYYAAKSWKGVRHAVHEDATGWSAEVFVPFSDIRSFRGAKIPTTAAGGITWIGNITRMRFGVPGLEKRRAEFSRVFTRYHNWNKDAAAFGPMPFKEW